MEQIKKLLEKRSATGLIVEFEERVPENDNDQEEKFGDCGQCSMYC